MSSTPALKRGSSALNSSTPAKKLKTDEDVLEQKDEEVSSGSLTACAAHNVYANSAHVAHMLLLIVVSASTDRYQDLAVSE